jgi:hypothetical protein
MELGGYHQSAPPSLKPREPKDRFPMFCPLRAPGVGGGGGGFINGYRPERENETVSVAIDEQVDIAACLAVTSGQG